MVKETLEVVFGFWLGKRMEAMQAAMMPAEQLKSLDLLPPHGGDHQLETLARDMIWVAMAMHVFFYDRVFRLERRPDWIAKEI